MDPLGLLRDTKLQHSLPLASAYAALLDHPPTTEQLKRQRARVDPTHREPLFTNISRYGRHHVLQPTLHLPLHPVYTSLADAQGHDKQVQHGLMQLSLTGCLH